MTIHNFNFRRRRQLGDIGINERIILKCRYMGIWTGFFCIRIGSNGEFFEHGNEPSPCTKGGEFLD
jgi:hypothetical protein